MKKLLLFVLLLPIGLRCSAQKLHYKSTTNQYLDTAGRYICWADGSSKGGYVELSRRVIKFDIGRKDRKVFTVIHADQWELQDEGYELQKLTAGQIIGNNNILICTIFIERKIKSKQVSDVTIRYYDREISYLIIPYTKDQAGYKWEQELKKRAHKG